MAKVVSVFFTVKSGRESYKNVPHGRGRARVTMRGTVAFDSTMIGEPLPNIVYVSCMTSVAPSGGVAARLAEALRSRESPIGMWMKPSFNTTLAVLDLSGCGIGPAGIASLVAALEPLSKCSGDWCFPSNLRALNLSSNRIGNAGAVRVATLLGPHKNRRFGMWTCNPSLARIRCTDYTIYNGYKFSNLIGFLGG